MDKVVQAEQKVKTTAPADSVSSLKSKRKV